MANANWCTNYREAGVTVEAALSSDHAPLWLRLFDQGRRRKLVRASKYEAYYALQKDCKTIIPRCGVRRLIKGEGG